MLRRNWKPLLVIIVVMAISLSAVVVQKFDVPPLGARGSDEILGLQLGLDLAGGIHLVYQAGDAETKPTDRQMEGLLKNIRRRVDSLGASEPNVQQLGSDRLLVQLPGVNDPERAKRLIGQTAQLRVVERLCENANPCSEYTDRDTGLTGQDVASASPGQGTISEPILLFELKRGSARAFGELTQGIYNTNTTDSPDELAFFLDTIELVSANVQSPILSGNGQIRGRFTSEEVRDLAIQIESGSLPIDIHVLTERVVDASLGRGSLEESLLAGIMGLALVMFFMVAYYRASGVVAALALVAYLTIVLAIFKLLPATLTLAGVAGLILSVGMAVDANILIFERVKEELRVGRTLNFAVQIGFQRAWNAIRDGNTTTLITAVIIYLFGTLSVAPAVTSFAVAVFVGVATSMFSAITISRALLLFLASSALQRHLGLFSPEPIIRRNQRADRPSQPTSEGRA